MQLTHIEATRARLLALATDIPGAWIGIKIAALLLILKGQRPGWITEVLGLTSMSLSWWMHGVNATGLHALPPKPRPGRPARLTPQVQQALAIHLEQSPQAFGLPRVQWDGPTLVVHRKRQFGIVLKVRQAQLWMHQLGYRLKRASHASLQARTAEARRFRQQVKKLAELGPHETLVFQDETGFTLHPRVGRGWAKCGQRLRVPTTSRHRERLNLSGWVAPLLGRQGMARTPRGNRAGFLIGLRHLYRRLKGYTMWLYVDRAGWHRGVGVESFLQTHPRLHVDSLPRYQPALNHQERIWRRVRYEATTNRWFEDLKAVWDTIRRTTHSGSPQKITR